MSVKVSEKAITSNADLGFWMVLKTQNPSEHPIISLYRNTSQGDFPIILVVGREPNDNRPMGHSVGQYEFPNKPVPFWDLPYSLMAGLIGKRGRELKKLCYERNSSPIAFSDISKRPITSTKSDKQEIRQSLTTDDYVVHLKEVASKPVFHRVRLVVFSGLNYPIWAERKYGEALRKMESEWNSKGIDTAEVPFFCVQNMKAIKKAFLPVKAAAKAILEDWLFKLAWG